jgi:hypothetical protein
MGTTQKKPADQRFFHFAAADYSQRWRTKMGAVNKFVLLKGPMSPGREAPVHASKKSRPGERRCLATGRFLVNFKTTLSLERPF